MTIAKRVLVICGSMNQTTQTHEFSPQLTEYEQSFTPYYCDGVHKTMRPMKRLWLPLWIAGTAAMGVSNAHRAFCVASEKRVPG